MFGPAGFTYVYLIYGMYYCFNIVTEQEGFPAAVLIRGVYMYSPNCHNINGPGKLCKIFGITKEHNQVDITRSTNLLVCDIGIHPSFSITTRIGINKGLDKMWRYVVDELLKLSLYLE